MASSTIHLMRSTVIHIREERKIVKAELRAILLLALIVLVAVTLTHHATDFFFIALLIMWSRIYRWLCHLTIRQSLLTLLVVASILFASLQISHQGNPVVGYLTSFMTSLFSHSGKHFVAKSLHAYVPMTWEKNMAQYETNFTLALLPLGLLCLWRRYRSHDHIMMLGITALGFPLSQLLRTSDNGIQLADRASVILYIGVSSVLAVLIVQCWPVRRLTWIHAIAIASVMTGMFLGGYVLSGGSGYGSPPTPYVVGADSRSIEIEGIQAAVWTRSYLGPNNRIGTDRTNQLLMATFGGQRVVDGVADHVDVAAIFFSPSLSPEDVALLQKGQLRYLVVDQRLSESLPAVGVYYEKDEPGALQHTSPVDPQALTKFNTMPNVDRVFDGGDMVIYYVGDLTNAP